MAWAEGREKADEAFAPQAPDAGSGRGPRDAERSRDPGDIQPTPVPGRKKREKLLGLHTPEDGRAGCLLAGSGDFRQRCRDHCEFVKSGKTVATDEASRFAKSGKTVATDEACRFAKSGKTVATDEASRFAKSGKTVATSCEIARGGTWCWRPFRIRPKWQVVFHFLRNRKEGNKVGRPVSATLQKRKGRGEAYAIGGRIFPR